MSQPIRRRTFLNNASLVALAPTVPTFLSSAVAADVTHDDRILVVVQLSGGNDGINTVVPYRDQGYAKHRPTLKLPTKDLLKVNESVGLHRSLRGFADLLADHRLSIVQGVGYPNPNRSHDVSMSIWQTARFDPAEHHSYGWIGRAMDSRERPANGASHAMLVGNESTPVALRGRRCVTASLESLQEMTRDAEIGTPATTTSSTSDLSAFVTRSMLDAYATSDLVESVAKRNKESEASYPATPLGNRLRTIAGLIKAEFGTPVYYAIQGGYDTHAVQDALHSSLLRDLDRTLTAFADDLQESGLDDHVVTMCFSEFGRRVDENGSLGTDHGTAGPMFLLGKHVKSGLIGSTPSMTDLVDGDLKVGIDFRGVYASVLEDWLGVPASTIVGADVDKVAVIS